MNVFMINIWILAGCITGLFIFFIVLLLIWLTLNIKETKENEILRREKEDLDKGFID